MTRHLAIAAGLVAALASPALAGVNPGGPIIRAAGPVPANAGAVAGPSTRIATAISRFGSTPWLPKVSPATFTQASNVVRSFSVFCAQHVVGVPPITTPCPIPKSANDGSPIGRPILPCFGCPGFIHSSSLVGDARWRPSAIAHFIVVPALVLSRHMDPPRPASRVSGHSFGLSLQLGKAPQLFGTIHQ